MNGFMVSFDFPIRRLATVLQTQSGTLASTVAAAFFASVLLTVGCGKQETAGVPAGTNVTMPDSAAEDAAASEAVVSQFLDRIRRGGEDHNAMALLTELAQSELGRVGQVVQPIGSPDAQFQITRSTPMPVDPDSAEQAKLIGRLVHCLWTEPAGVDASGQPSGKPESYQVVWSVLKQTEGWRISGLVLELDQNQPPLVLDFENGDMMAKILGGTPQAQTATGPADTGAPVSR